MGTVFLTEHKLPGRHDSVWAAVALVAQLACGSITLVPGMLACVYEFQLFRSMQVAITKGAYAVCDCSHVQGQAGGS